MLAGVGAGPPNFVGMTPVGALTLWVVLTTACGAGAAACVWKLGFAFMAACTAPGAALQEYTGCFGWSEWFLSIAIVLLSFGFFATASKSTTAAVHVVSGGTRGEKCCGTMSLIVLVVFMAVTSFASMYYLAKPWETYQTDASGVTKDSPEWTIDNWLVFLGSGMFAGAAPFFVALLAVCFNLCRKQPPRFNSQSGEFDEMAAEPRRRDLEHNLIEHKGAAHSKQHTPLFSAWKVFSALAVVGLCYLATTIGSPMWNYSANSYFMSRSDYTWGNLSIGGERPCFTAGNCSCGDYDYCPWFSFHAYTDTFIYYATLATGVVVASIAHNVRCCACARRTVGGPTAPWAKNCLPSVFHVYKQGCSVLEAVAIATCVCLFIFWFIYW